MKFSHKWLNEYFEEDLPQIKDLGEILTFHAFEIDGIEGDLIDIDVLPNRTHDCFCYQGIAKEISVLTGLKLKSLDKNFEVKKGLNSFDYISLKVEDSNLIPRATKRLVQNVKVGESPDWLKEKLESIGQKSINNIVDVTNYVMWETGQPVHAFDFDKIAEGEKGIKEFNIRRAEAGEKITTLDGQEFELDEETIVIADKEKALDIAGTKGGIVSGIDENTKNVVLSVCNFNQTNIRKTSKKLNLRTDASTRFENGISPDKVGEAMERLSQLVFEIAEGEVSEDVLDEYPRKANFFKVGVSVAEINRLLGLSLSGEEVENIFNRLDFKYEKVNPIDRVLELAPTLEGKSYKLGASVTYDAPNKFDCSSFTAYLFAQAGIGIPRVSVDQYVWGKEISEGDLQAGDLIFFNTEKGKIHKETLEFLKGTKVEEGIDHVVLYMGPTSPAGRERKIIHASLKNGDNGSVLIEDLNNFKYFKNIVGYRRISDNSERFVITAPHERLDLRIKEDLIEEVGRIYGYRNIESAPVEKIFEPKINKKFYYINKIKNILIQEGFDEVYTYTFRDKGNVEVKKPQASNLNKLRTNLSDSLQKNLEMNIKNAPLLGMEEIKIFEIGKVFESLDKEYWSLAIGVEVVKKSKKSAIVREGILQKVIILLQKTLQTNNIDLETGFPSGKEGVWEIDLSEVIEQLPEPKNYEDVLKLDSEETVIFKKISQYPFMLRDIAVWVSNESTSEDLLNLIKENAGELLVQTKLFDTYAPEGEDKTSFAFNLIFQSQEKTLTDEEINGVMDKINKEIEVRGWEVR